MPWTEFLRQALDKLHASPDPRGPKPVSVITAEVEEPVRDMGEIEEPPQSIGDKIVAPLKLQKSPTAQKAYEVLKQKAVAATDAVRPIVKKLVPNPDGAMEKILAPARSAERVLGTDPEAEYRAQREKDLDRQIEEAKKAVEEAKKRK